MAGPAPTTPPALPGADSGGVRNPWLWGCLAAAVLILAVRKTDAFMRPQFWAEDAEPFYLDALRAEPGTFLRSYAGYYHLLPRLIAWGASLLDPCLAPAFFVGASLLVTLGIVALIFSDRLAVPGKPLLALAVVLVPHSGEIFLTPTNLQWFGALALFLTALKTDPRRASEWIVDVLVLLVFGLSGVFIVLVLPFFFVRILSRRSRPSGLLLALGVLLAAVQVIEFTHFVPTPDSDTPVHWPAFFTYLSLHVPWELFGSQAWAGLLPRWLAIALGALGMAGFVALAWSPRREQALPRFAMLAFALILVLAATRRVRFDGPRADDFVMVDRYVVLPKVMLLWILGSAAATGGVRGRIAGALLATSLVVTLPYLRFPPLLDLEWHRYCGDLRAGKEVTVPVNPGWPITFPASPPRHPLPSGAPAPRK